MIVIPLRLRYRDREVYVDAVLNTGFESNAPLISLPLDLDEELNVGFSEVKEYDTVGRFRGLAMISDEPIEVTVEKNGRKVCEKAFVVVVPGEEEAIISYALARKLRLTVDLASEEWWIT